MFKNLDMTRIKTGALLIAVIALIAYIDSFFLTWLFLGVAYMLAFHEAMRLMSIKDDKLYIYALVLWFVAFLYPNPDDLIFIALIIYISHMIFSGDVNFRKIEPLAYPVSSFLFLLALYRNFGMEAVIWLVLIVATTDIAAYFVGKAIGKRKFNPISPNKTWEGVIGGVAAATIVGYIYGDGYVLGALAVAVSLFVSIASIFGDLFESFLKRNAGVKDSGSILPGHGGVLDRVDGYMFGAIVMVVMLRGLA